MDSMNITYSTDAEVLEEHGVFAGSGARSKDAMNEGMYKCEHPECKLREVPFKNMTANVIKGEFVKFDDPQIEQAMFKCGLEACSSGGEYSTKKNKAGEAIQMMCYQCCGRMMHGDENYFVSAKRARKKHNSVPGKDEGTRFTADWQRKSKSSHNPPTGSTRAARVKTILAGKQKKLDETYDGEPPLIACAHDMIKQSEEARQGTDWVSTLSWLADVHINYAHRRCNPKMFFKYQSHLIKTMKNLNIVDPGICPIRGCDWILMRPDDAVEADWDTAFKGQKKGGCKWACPGCCDIYLPSVDNDSRVVILGAHNKSTGKSTYDPECVRVGEIGPDLENEICQLKAATLKECMKEWDDEPITPDSIMRALGRLQDQLMEKLTKTVRTVTIHVPDNKDMESNSWQKSMYCHDRRLSIAHKGEKIKVLIFDDKDLGEPLGNESMRLIIDFCAQFLDLESLRDRTNGKATKKLINGMIGRTKPMIERCKN